MSLAALTLGAVLAAAPATPDYAHEIDAWRAKREAELRAPDGWLSVVGLHELREGTHTVGSAEGSDILLPASAPPRVGTITLTAGHAAVHVAAGISVQSGDKPVTDLDLHSD